MMPASKGLDIQTPANKKPRKTVADIDLKFQNTMKVFCRVKPLDDEDEQEYLIVSPEHPTELKMKRTSKKELDF